MPDQATELRKLVLQAARTRSMEAGPSPRMLLVTGGRAGVGTTTLAVNLSVALASWGTRVVLVDTDFGGEGVAALCGLERAESIVDVMIGRRDIHEVLQRGPGGVLVAAGPGTPARPVERTEMSDHRLQRQFRSLGRHADIVVLDAGWANASSIVQRLWLTAEDVVLVTTPEPGAIMDAYAMIKTLSTRSASRSPRLIVNQSEKQVALDVHERVDQSCRRFLSLSVELLGHVPPDDSVPDAAQRRMPFAVPKGITPAALAVVELAHRLGVPDGSQPAYLSSSVG